MASLEKWVDELQAAVDKLTKRVANAAASAFKPEIATPTDGQVIMYDSTAEAWKNGDVFSPEITEPTDGQAIVYDATAGKWVNGNTVPPAPEPANPLLLINHGTTVDNEMIMSQDSVSTWISGGAKIKSGSGTFCSYVISSGAKITPADYDTFSATYTFGGTSHTESVTLDQAAFVEGVTYDFGVYYITSAQGNAVGMIYAPTLRPQDFTMVPISTSTSSSGDVVISEISLSKPIITNKRRTKK